MSKSSLCVLKKKVQRPPRRAATVAVIIGVGSATFETSGAMAVANLETKLRNPNEVDENKVGKTEACET